MEDGLFDLITHCRLDGRIYINDVELHQYKTSRGYLAVKKMIKGEDYRAQAHRIVYRYFNGKIPDNLEINHIDMNKTNNHLSNLEAVTHQDNIRHAIRNNKPGYRFNKGDRIGAKLSIDDVITIKQMLLDKALQRIIAKKFHVTPGTIGHIKHGRSWNEVTV